MRQWLVQHARAAGSAWAAVRRAPLGTAFNAGVIALALALPCALWLLSGELQGAVRDRDVTPQISVFLSAGTSRETAAGIGAQLRKLGGVVGVDFVPRDRALADLRKNAGLQDLIDSLDSNPLPDAFIVSTNAGGASTLEALRDVVQRWPNVAHVALDALWARRLDAAVLLVRRAAAVLLGVLGLALIAVVFNTVRLQILTQRHEIAVMQTIGATPAYVRRPFLYYGLAVGALGGLLGWALLSIGTEAANEAIKPLAGLYGGPWHLDRPSPAFGASMAAAAGLIGWLGASLSVSRHLLRI